MFPEALQLLSRSSPGWLLGNWFRSSAGWNFKVRIWRASNSSLSYAPLSLLMARKGRA